MADSRDIARSEWPIGDIRPNENNPRNKAAGDSSFPGLVESIRSQGVLQPLLISGDGKILAGHRRYYAALEIGLESVPVRVLPATINQTLVPLIENLQRADLGVLEVADYLLRCHREHEMNLASIAAMTGLSNTTVGKYIKLAEGPPEVRDRIERDDIPIDAAFELLRHDPAFIREMVKEPVLTKQIVRARAEGKETAASSAPPQTADERRRRFLSRQLQKLCDVDEALDHIEGLRDAQTLIRQAQALIRRASDHVLEKMAESAHGREREPEPVESYSRSSLLNY